MSTENVTALTWKFSVQVSDPADTTPESVNLKVSFVDDPLVQYFAFHTVRHSKTQAVYIRGILRWHRPRSVLQIKDYLVGPSYKPIRGRFTQTTVDDLLRPTNRIGDLFESGVVTSGSSKRPLNCLGLCPCCCPSNKRPAI